MGNKDWRWWRVWKWSKVLLQNGLNHGLCGCGWEDGKGVTMGSGRGAGREWRKDNSSVERRDRSVCLALCLSIYLLSYLSTHFSVPIFFFVCLSVCLPFCHRLSSFLAPIIHTYIPTISLLPLTSAFPSSVTPPPPAPISPSHPHTPRNPWPHPSTSSSSFKLLPPAEHPLPLSPFHLSSPPSPLPHLLQPITSPIHFLSHPFPLPNLSSQSLSSLSIYRPLPLFLATISSPFLTRLFSPPLSPLLCPSPPLHYYHIHFQPLPPPLCFIFHPFPCHSLLSFHSLLPTPLTSFTSLFHPCQPPSYYSAHPSHSHPSTPHLYSTSFTPHLHHPSYSSRPSPTHPARADHLSHHILKYC